MTRRLFLFALPLLNLFRLKYRQPGLSTPVQDDVFHIPIKKPEWEKVTSVTFSTNEQDATAIYYYAKDGIWRLPR